MQNAHWSKPSEQIKELKHISLVIIRLEIDDLSSEALLTSSSSSSSSFDVENFNYYSRAYLDKQQSNKVEVGLVEDTSPVLSKQLTAEKLKSLADSTKEDALRVYIGKRQSRPIIVETYFVHDHLKRRSSSMSSQTSTSSTNQNSTTKNETSSSNSQHEQQTQKHVNNAMTMQNALETAYNDWNREKNTTKLEIEANNMENNNKSLHDLTTVDDGQSSSLVSVPETDQLTVATTTTTKTKKNKKIKNPKPNNNNDDDERAAKETQQQSIINTDDSNTSEIAFYYGNPAVDIIKGFLHIYKDCNLITVDDKAKEPSTVRVKSELLCMIAIPSSLSCNDLLDFLMPFSETIEYMRIIRDNFPNQYMALIKLKTQSDADAFYKHNQNRQFNSFEENVCHLAYVERIEAMNSSKGASLPIPGFAELPTCYICLERMDESLNGVITILCNHSFHANCLSKWGDTCCPVCRYAQTPEYQMDNMCTECGSHENLWVCLICGHVGCGRYVRGHAHNHYKQTEHIYSMQIGTNNVWDYAADNYVHRLIQNKTDGKLVQLDEGGRVVNHDDKIDSITLEYTYLLTSQLESQRLFFEERLLKLEEKSKSQLIELETKSRQLETENDKLKENVTQLTKEKSNFEKKCSTLNSKLTKLQSELDEEKELNKCLSSNQEVYQSKLAKVEENLKRLGQEKDQEIEELKSQLKDIMFYLDAQAKISQSSEISKEELEQSQVIIQQNQAQASPAGQGAAGTSSSLSGSSKKSNNNRRSKK